jgi:hypothetical protein
MLAIETGSRATRLLQLVRFALHLCARRELLLIAVALIGTTAAAAPQVNPPKPPPPEVWFGAGDATLESGGAGHGTDGDGSGGAGGETVDCNGNGLPDYLESVPDCDQNGVGDWCQIAANPALDCNRNGILDSCEIGQPGGKGDCDGNGILDVCQPEFRVAGGAGGGTGADCNGNGVADRLEICRNPRLDCDGNGLLDKCEHPGAAGDCDGNGVPDACEISQDPSLDCDGDGVLNACEGSCTSLSFADGPHFLGDGDWGRWRVQLPPECSNPQFSVDYGPVSFMQWDGEFAHFQADELSPDQGPAQARLRVTASCNGCECSATILVIVQVYSHIHVEARAFIPCEAVGALSMIDELVGVFDGDCRGFLCDTPQLPTNGIVPSSRVLAGVACSLRLCTAPGGWWAPWAAVTASRRASFWQAQHPSQFNSCAGVPVPVASSGSQCVYQVLSWLPACFPASANPIPAAFDRTTCAGTAAGVQYVGAPRYKEIRLVLAAANSCIDDAPDINMEVQVWLWQRCDPTDGMAEARVDYSGRHDLFPAYELVIEEEAACANFRRGCLYSCSPTGSPIHLFAGPEFWQLGPRTRFGPPPAYVEHPVLACPQETPTALYWKPLSFYFN